ncbi:hypothetical protein QBC32DRAFT_398401 [Pseudoneurospora amorphoporcata]|uniref:AA1-like domain-containing protein n=1 Tax=Pseudoneurospora amorphoporcata TaxID=241081 RepID=A0AAN6SG80_9PEZI|nr:hypothetical protein QBC32DRAFT_398401 [Pseudoneurospora amorphoporcata]
MKFLQLLVATTPVALASPLSNNGIRRDTSGSQQVNIELQVNKVTSESTIEVWNEDNTQMLTQSCSTSLALKTGRTTNSPISFNVDHDGFGTLTFGDKTYTISGNPEVSGGIECNSIVSDSETLISCTVTGVSPDIAEVARWANQDGRQVISLAETMRTWQELDLEEAAIAGNETLQDNDMEVPSKRQYNPCSQWTPTTIREGDGDPHQAPKHIQVTESMDCGNGECSISHFDAHSMTIRFTAGAKLSTWSSAGFRVEQSTTTGMIKECKAGAYDWVAGWMKVGRTQYRVRNGLFNACTGTKPHGDVFTITSPNTNNRGGNPYCVGGKRYVRNLGDSWDETPKPGRP